METRFVNRDISWLSFNERVLREAGSIEVPLLERLKFLSIYSSNLDEFYRVRIPAIMALQQLGRHEDANIAATVSSTILKQQELFGSILHNGILPSLYENGINFLYNNDIPQHLKGNAERYFFSNVAAFLQIIDLEATKDFFPENNRIYFLVRIATGDREQQFLINIPAIEAGRFLSIEEETAISVIMLDDIIRENLHHIFPSAAILACHSFKITRDAELDLEDEYKGDIAEQIEKQIAIRDFGIATRVLYDAAMPETDISFIVKAFRLEHANLMSGGKYHNLKDLADFPVTDKRLSLKRWPAIGRDRSAASLFSDIRSKDIMLHVPYQSYDTLLGFFNAAAIDTRVTEIAITLYRIAGDSRIGNALMNAAKNGKRVTVFVELKARFDEANNIRWAKRMKAAGVKIIYSIPGLKVHAKVALVKRKEEGRSRYYGVFATGNFNESTARFYTDHILLTADKNMLQELELLFLFLAKRRKPREEEAFKPQHLLIAQFNLLQQFTDLIDFEIAQAKQAKPAAITIKMNNLEEEVLISKLYEASGAGVKVRMIIRGICRLRPGVAGLSDNISVTRIVDRYLEHGRIFIFEHGGEEKIYLGSADWMNRNIYRRIEVCFPVLDADLRREIKEITDIQLRDNVKAVAIGPQGANIPIHNDKAPLESQAAIYDLLHTKNQI